MQHDLEKTFCISFASSNLSIDSGHPSTAHYECHEVQRLQAALQAQSVHHVTLSDILDGHYYELVREDKKDRSTEMDKQNYTPSGTISTGKAPQKVATSVHKKNAAPRPNKTMASPVLHNRLSESEEPNERKEGSGPTTSPQSDQIKKSFFATPF